MPIVILMLSNMLCNEMKRLTTISGVSIESSNGIAPNSISPLASTSKIFLGIKQRLFKTMEVVADYK
jgi:hypothetical protein